MVEVLWFAGLREQLGADRLELEQVPGNVGGLRAMLAGRYPELSAKLNSCHVAVNEQYADDETPLGDSDTVAFIPPVSGG